VSSVSADVAATAARVGQLQELCTAIGGSPTGSASSLGASTDSAAAGTGADFASLLEARAAPATSAADVATPTVAVGAMATSGSGAGGNPDGPLINQAAQRYGINPALLYGVIRQESDFDPTAVSSAGAEGLAQIMPENFAGLGVSDPFDPVQSIDAGAQMLAQNLATFGGDATDALAAYNAGVGAVTTYDGVPPYAQTQNYVRQVLGYASEYQASADGDAPSPLTGVASSYGVDPADASTTTYTPLVAGESTDDPVAAAQYPWASDPTTTAAPQVASQDPTTAAQYPWTSDPTTPTPLVAGEDPVAAAQYPWTSDPTNSTPLVAGESTDDPAVAAQYPWAPDPAAVSKASGELA
jgi:hypothetical protein